VSLNDLAVEYSTDKQKGHHNYVTVYEPLFEGFRQDTFNFLEIGILRGASHKMWRDWFPNATIYAIDITKYGEDSAFRKLERMVVDTVDQGDRQQLIEYAKKGPWKVIIDDGSHIVSHQKLSFEILWDQVEPGGYYIIEDTHTSYRGGSHFMDSDETLVQRMLRLADEVCDTPYGGKTRRTYSVENVKNMSKYQAEVESIEFRLSLIIVKKRGGENSR
jgi:hypothetical protein